MTVENAPELPEFYECLSSISKHSKEFDEAVAKVKEVLFNDEVDTKNGISLLDLKNQTVLNYLISLLTLILRKVEGKDIEEVRWNTIVNRTVLERIRPLENKLHYQIEKLMRVSTDKNDALNFKPDVEDLESSEDEQENEEGGLYKAPRIAAAHYYEPEPRGKRTKTEATTPKLGKTVLEELRKEMSSAPEEVSYASSQKQDKEVKDRTEYEEANFMRMSLSKSERKKPRIQSGLNNILDLDDAEMFRSAEAERSGKRGQKKSFRGKKSKKFRKKR